MKCPYIIFYCWLVYFSTFLVKKKKTKHTHHCFAGQSWPDVQQIYLSAHAYLPQRVEPLYAVGHYYYHEQWPRNYQLAFLFLHRASMFKFPTNLRLFLDKTVYDFKVRCDNIVMHNRNLFGRNHPNYLLRSIS